MILRLRKKTDHLKLAANDIEIQEATINDGEKGESGDRFNWNFSTFLIFKMTEAVQPYS